jgi:hypothetical protein
MSISACATHVMSAMLAVVIAFPGAGWPSADRTTHCMKQMACCQHSAAVTCCLPTAPTPIDRVLQPQVAPSPEHVAHATLMDTFVPPALVGPQPDVPSAHWVRALDLSLLHRTLVI